MKYLENTQFKCSYEEMVLMKMMMLMKSVTVPKISRLLILKKITLESIDSLLVEIANISSPSTKERKQLNPIFRKNYAIHRTIY